MLLPEWFPFHIKKVSYWSRAVMVPLFVLCSLKPRAKNPRAIDIRELFTTPPEKEYRYFPAWSGLNRVFLALDRFGRTLEPLVPGWVRRRAIAKAERWIIERLNGTDGLGGIFPAMVNAHEVLAVLGYSAEHSHRVATKEALRKLLVVNREDAYCQPCVSPIWDTALACLAVREASEDRNDADTRPALDWLRERQLRDEPGDWRDKRPHLRGGGWPFQFANPHYPDIDDTPVVAWALYDADPVRYRDSNERAGEWLVGMQSSNGGFASFDVDNTHDYLNAIPFADHGALLDPSTSDVTARCVAFLSKVEREKYRDAIDTAIRFLRAEQEPDGSWFGRWGTNYLYGTWAVLAGLECAGESLKQLYIRRAVDWLKRIQRSDGGWGEDNESYTDPGKAGQGPRSTSFQTAWAILGLIAADEGHCDAARRGVEYLLRNQRPDALWHDDEFTAPGFPRVFYLEYHGYTRYFPLWALARYRNRIQAGLATI